LTQQILQNYIAYRVYNPNQAWDEEVWWNAVIGAGVGAESELGRTALARLAALRGRRRGGTQTDAALTPEAVDLQWQRAEAEARAANCTGANSWVVVRMKETRR